MTFMALHIFFLTFILPVVVISLYNFLKGPYLEELPPGGDIPEPEVSILVPARDEENNITRCLDNIFGLEYRNKEVIVYDDESSDLTPELLEKYARRRPELKVIRGGAKPEGWTGKSWACHKLHQAAAGEIFVFVDADVLLYPLSVSRAVNFLAKSDVSLLSCFPSQQMRTLGEWLVVPLMNWILLSLLPLRQVYESGLPSVAAANGQFMVFKRHDYTSGGGHQAVKNRPVEDVAMASLFKSKGMRVMTLLSRKEISCRMYHGLRQSVQGFSKNFFPGFNMPACLFLCFLAVLFAGFFMPLILVFLSASFLLEIFLIGISRFFVSLSSGQNALVNIALHPGQMICLVFTGIRSLYVTLSGNIRWKGRRL